MVIVAYDSALRSGCCESLVLIDDHEERLWLASKPSAPLCLALQHKHTNNPKCTRMYENTQNTQYTKSSDGKQTIHHW